MKNNYYFIIFILVFNLFFSLESQSQTTTWDGTSWDNGVPTITTDAIFRGNFSSSTNISAKSITVTNNAQVVINSSHSLTCENEVTMNAGSNLIFENNASLVQINASAINVGTIIYRRNSTAIRQYEYTYWSSPVSGQTLINFSPLTSYDRFHSFDNVANQWYNESSSSTMQSGKGYAIRVPNNFTSTPQIFNGEFIGTPNNGNISASVVALNPSILNYSLLGNPYPSAISVASLIDNSTLGTLYFWTHNSSLNNNNFSNTDYAVRTRNSGVAAVSGGSIPSPYIAAGQGFFASSSLNGTITFTNTMRVGTNNSQFYKKDVTYYYYWLNMTNAGGAFKQVSIGYEQGATNGYDFGIDALPISGTNVITFYSLINTGKFSIQGREFPWNVNDIIPIGYDCTVADTYQIELDHNETFFDDKDIFLEDTETSTFHNLKSGAYSFSSAIGTFDTRFKIRYTNPTLANHNQTINPNTVYSYVNGNNVELYSSVEKIKSIAIYDLVGRNIFKSNDVCHNKYIIDTTLIKNQTIIVTITLENNQIINKKIIL